MRAAKARPWLPDAALCDGILAARLGQAVEAWSARWICEGPAISLIQEGVDAVTDGLLDREPASMSVMASQEEKLHLAAAILGLGTAGRANQADQSLMNGLAEEALTALQGAITSRLAPGIPLSTNTTKLALRFVAKRGDQNVFTVWLDRCLAVTARLEGVEPLRVPEKPQERGEALRTLTIGIGARVGAGRLGIGEIEGLAPGDIVVLDKGVGETLSLTIGGRTMPGVSCRAIEREVHMCLSISGQEPRT